ncbi:MAG TPA: NADPH-dependent 7-cyano-7-deazaguanine reductase QueF [Casimicrobiaceae bacterium]|nr:NADPH-dependent 7-cyano-7-deazaguanine reductase QueF [Casimicrobiaceae bacterium]
MSAAGPTQGAHPPSGGGGANRRSGGEHTSPQPGDLAGAPLGHATGYPDTYDPTQLFAIARAPQRTEIGIGDKLPFAGSDVWTAYELTWLDARGKPAIALATIEVPASSSSLIESKSMKLYLGSFAQSSFASSADVAATIERDLAARTDADVRVMLRAPAGFASERFAELPGDSLDDLEIACTDGDVDTSTLTRESTVVEEALTTNLFRSVCPVTGQPDLASVRIAYRGPRIARAGLLRYLVSYRRHPGFHEHCVERIFVDVAARCAPDVLTVEARFTRRGGIDINPFRTNAALATPPNVRTARQ